MYMIRLLLNFFVLLPAAYPVRVLPGFLLARSMRGALLMLSSTAFADAAIFPARPEDLGAELLRPAAVLTLSPVSENALAPGTSPVCLPGVRSVLKFLGRSSNLLTGLRAAIRPGLRAVVPAGFSISGNPVLSAIVTPHSYNYVYNNSCQFPSQINVTYP
jgi:hypothetical protein